MKNNEIIEFYKQTSCYTDLGLYKDFAKSLPDNIQELCILQRMQIIHPIAFQNKELRNKKDCFWGDMTQIKDTRLLREDDVFPTSLSMLAELIRRNKEYTVKRKSQEKIFVTCRGQALLLAAILKAKKIPARVRSGFAKYPSNSAIYLDHWVTEYYNESEKRWILVDADCCCNEGLDFNIYDIPKDKFKMPASIWLEFGQNKLDVSEIGHACFGKDAKEQMKILTTALFYDFHCLMNDEIIYLHYPKYLINQDFELTDSDLLELDELARLMLEPEENFKSLREIWNNKDKFRIMGGGTITK